MVTIWYYDVGVYQITMVVRSHTIFFCFLTFTMVSPWCLSIYHGNTVVFCEVPWKLANMLIIQFHAIYLSCTVLPSDTITALFLQGIQTLYTEEPHEFHMCKITQDHLGKM